MAYTGRNLAAHAKKAIGRHYLYGGLNKPLTLAYLNWLRSTYPDEVTAEKYATAKNWIGETVTDCSGLIRSYYPEAFSTSAKKVYTLDRNNTSAVPVGAVLARPGHYGVYIGDGYEVDAMGFDYGVVKRAVKDTAFTQYWTFNEFTYGGPLWPWLLATGVAIYLITKK